MTFLSALLVPAANAMQLVSCQVNMVGTTFVEWDLDRAEARTATPTGYAGAAAAAGIPVPVLDVWVAVLAKEQADDIKRLVDGGASFVRVRVAQDAVVTWMVTGLGVPPKLNSWAVPIPAPKVATKDPCIGRPRAWSELDASELISGLTELPDVWLGPVLQNLGAGRDGQLTVAIRGFDEGTLARALRNLNDEYLELAMDWLDEPGLLRAAHGLSHPEAVHAYGLMVDENSKAIFKPAAGL
jgi:hypothetical protein